MMKDEIKKACEIMQKGGVILYPTDTVWGIGCDATNEEAVKRVYEIKHRADSKAMLVLVDSPVKVDFYVSDVPPVAWDLIEMTTKPLTIIYDGARNLAPNPSSPLILVSVGSSFKSPIMMIFAFGSRLYSESHIALTDKAAAIRFGREASSPP